jgi:hypothetical protein
VTSVRDNRACGAAQFLPFSLRSDTFSDRQLSAMQSFNYRTALA